MNAVTSKEKIEVVGLLVKIGLKLAPLVVVGALLFRRGAEYASDILVPDWYFPWGVGLVLLGVAALYWVLPSKERIVCAAATILMAGLSAFLGLFVFDVERPWRLLYSSFLRGCW